MKGNVLDGSKVATFQTDLDEAHEEEKKLGEWCCKHEDCTFETTQMNGSDPRWDLMLKFNDGSPSVTIEVKMDKYSSRSGNIAIEYQRTMKDQTVKKTCISVSEADYWVYIFDDCYHFIRTDALRKMIADKKWFDKKHSSGEGSRASIFLFKKEVFKKHCVIFSKDE